MAFSNEVLKYTHATQALLKGMKLSFVVGLASYAFSAAMATGPQAAAMVMSRIRSVGGLRSEGRVTELGERESGIGDEERRSGYILEKLSMVAPLFGSEAEDR